MVANIAGYEYGEGLGRYIPQFINVAKDLEFPRLGQLGRKRTQSQSQSAEKVDGSRGGKMQRRDTYPPVPQILDYYERAVKDQEGLTKETAIDVESEMGDNAVDISATVQPSDGAIGGITNGPSEDQLVLAPDAPDSQ